MATSKKAVEETVEEKLVRVEAEFAKFRDAVVAKAVELKKENGYCEVVNDALRDLGLPVPPEPENFAIDDDILIVVDGDPIEDSYRVTDEQKAVRLAAFRKWANDDKREIRWDRYDERWEIK